MATSIRDLSRTRQQQVSYLDMLSHSFRFLFFFFFFNHRLRRCRCVGRWRMASMVDAHRRRVHCTTCCKYYNASFVHFIRWFVCSFIRSFVCSFVYSFVRSFIRVHFVHFVHSFVASFVRSFIRSFIWFVRSFASFVRFVRIHKSLS
jgi:hypothetical protein